MDALKGIKVFKHIQAFTLNVLCRTSFLVIITSVYIARHCWIEKLFQPHAKNGSVHIYLLLSCIIWNVAISIISVHSLNPFALTVENNNFLDYYECIACSLLVWAFSSDVTHSSQKSSYLWVVHIFCSSLKAYSLFYLCTTSCHTLKMYSRQEKEC